MKISGKVYILIKNTFFYKFIIGLHNSLNPRLDTLASWDDNLPVNSGHYNQDLGIVGGQGVMRVFIDISLNFAPHEII
jgi:hypothetical protein